MHENEYAYAVARIRANEVNLLTPAETEQLISAESYEAALRLLGDKGWHTDGVGHDYAPMLEEHVNAAWQLLKESAPDASLLDALVINNDFFNLKAALKANQRALPSDSGVPDFLRQLQGSGEATRVKVRGVSVAPPAPSAG